MNDMGTSVQNLWENLKGQCEAFLEKFPELITEILKLTAVAFNVRCGRPSRKAQADKQEEISAYFDDGKDHSAVLNTMERKLSEGAFICRKSRGDDEATIFAIGFLLPGSPAFPIGAYTPIDGLAWDLPDTTGVQVPSVEEIRTNPVARDRLLQDFDNSKAVSMVMMARLSEARVRRAESELAGLDSDSDDEDASNEDKRKSKAAKEKLRKEVDSGPDAGTLQRFDLNPHLLRGNHESVKALGNSSFYMSAKSMTQSWSKADISRLANEVAELVATDEDHKNHFYTGQGYMSWMGHSQSFESMANADEEVRDITVDLTGSGGRNNVISKSTAFRLSALALAQAAIDAGLAFEKLPSGVKREMAVADPSLAKRVKTELSAMTDKAITKKFFVFQDEVDKLTGMVTDRDLRIASLEKMLESRKAGSSSEGDFTSSDNEGSEAN